MSVVAVRLSDHARQRCAERGVPEAIALDALARPVLVGDAGPDRLGRPCRYSAKPAVLGARREWVVVIFGDDGGERIALTVLVGRPSRGMRHDG